MKQESGCRARGARRGVWEAWKARKGKGEAGLAFSGGGDTVVPSSQPWPGDPGFSRVSQDLSLQIAQFSGGGEKARSKQSSEQLPEPVSSGETSLIPLASSPPLTLDALLHCCIRELSRPLCSDRA